VLKVPLPDVVRMQTRQPNLEGAGEISFRHLVREALRMRPQRIVVGEVRQQECLDLLIALNSGARSMRTRLGKPSPRCASGGGESKIAYGQPGAGDVLKFRFSPGDPNYKQLVSTPCLRATIVVDRDTSHIMSVRIHGRRT
jgi:Type II/IV secretion system protein